MADSNGWISITERLPTQWKMKAVFAGGQFRAGRWNDEHDHWYDSKGMCLDDVTHWQDPPEPPPDPADVELMDILEEAAKSIACISNTPGAREETLRYIVTEIKAWKDKHS